MIRSREEIKKKKDKQIEKINKKNTDKIEKL